MHLWDRLLLEPPLLNSQNKELFTAIGLQVEMPFVVKTYGMTWVAGSHPDTMQIFSLLRFAEYYRFFAEYFPDNTEVKLWSLVITIYTILFLFNISKLGIAVACNVIKADKSHHQTVHPVVQILLGPDLITVGP
jgi:hypothetical protein